MKKNLLVTPFYYPEDISTGVFNTHLIDASRAIGFNVDIFCSYPFYPYWVTSDEGVEDDAKVFRRGRNIKYPKSNLLRRLWLEIWFSMAFFVFFLKKRGAYERVVIHTPPTLVTFIAVLLKTKDVEVVSLVADLQWAHLNTVKNRLMKFASNLVCFIENSSFALSKRCIFMSLEMARQAERYFPLNRENLEIRYPGVTLLTKDISQENLTHISHKDFNVVYSGALGEKQMPEKLVRLFCACKEVAPNIEFFIFSAGKSYERLKKLKIYNAYVNFFPLVARESLAEMYLKSDVQVITQTPGTSHGSFPSKVPNLIYMRVPIFSISDQGGDLDQVLSNYPLGHVTQDSNIEALASALMAFIEKVKNLELDDEQHQQISEDLDRNFSVSSLARSLFA